MEMIKLQCQICKNACELTAEVEEDEVLDVTGNGCMRGYAYAQRCILHPEEMEQADS